MFPLTIIVPRSQHHRIDRVAGNAPGHLADGQGLLKSPSRCPLLPDPSRDVAAPFILSGVIFPEARLVERKSWPLEAFALGFPANAASAVVAISVVGELVDRMGAMRLLPCLTLPMAAGLTVLWASGSVAPDWLFPLLAGLTCGAQFVLMGAIWAEFYGTTHLGSIKSMASSAMILSTAAAPPLMGWLVDGGVQVDDPALMLWPPAPWWQPARWRCGRDANRGSTDAAEGGRGRGKLKRRSRRWRLTRDGRSVNHCRAR